MPFWQLQEIPLNRVNAKWTMAHADLNRTIVHFLAALGC